MSFWIYGLNMGFLRKAFIPYYIANFSVFGLKLLAIHTMKGYSKAGTFVDR